MNIKRLVGDRKLPRHASPPRTCRCAASARDERPHAQGPAQGRAPRRRWSSSWPRQKRGRRRDAGEEAAERRRRSRSAARSAASTTGFAHIQAPFNNTTDHDHRHRGQRGRLVERRRHRLQGVAQGHAVRGHPGGDGRRQRRARPRACARVEVRVKGPAPAASRRSARCRPPGSTSSRSATSRRFRTTAAGRPSAGACSPDQRSTITGWLVTSVRSAVCAAAKA